MTTPHQPTTAACKAALGTILADLIETTGVLQSHAPEAANGSGLRVSNAYRLCLLAQKHVGSAIKELDK